MSYAYASLIAPRNTTSGIAESVWLAPTSWFASGGLKKPIPGIDPGSEVTITETHLFLSKKGFIRLQLSPEKNAYNTETIGDKGHAKFSHTIKAFVPGSYAEAHEQIKFLKDTPLIAIVRDSSCEENMYYQVGNGCMSAWMMASFMTGTTVDGIKGYEVTFTAQSDYVTLYSGAITLAMGYIDAPGTLTFSDVLDVSMTVAWAAVASSSGYVLERATRSDFSNATQVYSGTSLSFAATGLTAGVTYYWRVKTTSATLNDSLYRSASQATVVLVPLTILNLGTPTNTSGTEWRLGVVIDSNTTHVRFQLTTVEGDYSTTAFNELVPKDIFTAPALYCLITTGLTPGTTYYWRVKAYAAGFADSPWYESTEEFTR